MARHPLLRVHFVLAITAALVLNACGGSSTPPSATGASSQPSDAAVTPAEQSTGSAPTTEPSSPAASGAVVVELGMVGTTPRGSRVTVHSFGPKDRSVESPAGADWVAADLEWCLPPTIVNDVTVGNIRYELNLVLSDGTTIEPEAEADSPDEVYASEGSFGADECVRGPMVFAVPTGAAADYLLLIGGKGGMRWRLSSS